MIRIAAISLFLFALNFVSARDVNVVVYEKESDETIPYAAVAIEYVDTVVRLTTDVDGKLTFMPRSFPMVLKAKSFGFTEEIVSVETYPDSALMIKLMPDYISLNEVEVKGELISQTNSGLSYNMAANQRAQAENALQSLSYVPLVDVDAEGSISVQGSSSFSLYLNGRPYEMAQTSPKIFLETLPASSIKKVEVITRPDNKYRPDTGRYILNIVLKKPMVEGYVANISGSGSTQPSANGTLMGMIKKRNIDFSLNYDYNLNGQRDQSVESEYQETNQDGALISEWKNSSTGDGDWHTHTMSAMLKWNIDSLNAIYADAHLRLQHTDMTQQNAQFQSFPEVEHPETQLRNHTEYTSGTVESNLIYRNYFNTKLDYERLMAGYHFTYNPDKRHLTQDRQAGDVSFPQYIQSSDGGMAEHSALISYLIILPSSHSLRLTANELFRHGSTDSEYFSGGEPLDSQYKMRYDNSISSIKVSYGGWIGKIYMMLSAKGSYDWFSIKLPDYEGLDNKREHFYFLPSALLFWRPDNYNSLYLSYSTNIIRPGVDELNPFVSSTNDFSEHRGNPNLKAQYSHDLSLTWYMTKVRNLTLAASLQYQHVDDAILQSFEVENNRITYRPENFGVSDKAGIVVNADYKPAGWLSLSANIGCGKRWLRSSGVDLKQNNDYCNISPGVNFYLPNHFRIGCKYGFYKNLPDPWCSRSSVNTYSFYAAKSFLNGRLNLTVTANSPFNKYNHSIVNQQLPTMKSRQDNYITARSFGIGVSYSFGGGKKVEIERDRVLKSSDQETGVR